jgi:2-keto-3-deoxy-6-phosphogluconate aldolase
VNSENIKEFFKSGAAAVAFGASIFRHDWITNGEFDKIGASIKKLLANLPQNS